MFYSAPATQLKIKYDLEVSYHVWTIIFDVMIQWNHKSFSIAENQVDFIIHAVCVTESNFQNFNYLTCINSQVAPLLIGVLLYKLLYNIIIVIKEN